MTTEAPAAASRRPNLRWSNRSAVSDAEDADEQTGQRGHRIRASDVVDPRAPLLPVHQPGLVQHLEVVADRRLGELEVRQQVAHARLRALVGQHQRQQPQPRRTSFESSSFHETAFCKIVRHWIMKVIHWSDLIRHWVRISQTHALVGSPRARRGRTRPSRYFIPSSFIRKAKRSASSSTCVASAVPWPWPVSMLMRR